MSIDCDTLFIGGEWVPATSSARLTITSASTEQVIGSVPEAREADVDAAVAAARRAFDDPHGWSQWEPSRRAAALERLADEIDTRAVELARRVSIQNGLPIAISSELEPGFPRKLLRYYAELIRNAPDDIAPRAHLFGGTTTVLREPMGVVGAIAPFNFPQTLASLKHAPALAAGCTVEEGDVLGESVGPLRLLVKDQPDRRRVAGGQFRQGMTLRCRTNSGELGDLTGRGFRHGEGTRCRLLAGLQQWRNHKRQFSKAKQTPNPKPQ